MSKPNGYHIRAENVKTGKVVAASIKVNNIQAIHIALAKYGFIVNEYRPAFVSKEKMLPKQYRTVGNGLQQ